MSAQQAIPGAEDAVTRDPLDFNRTPAWVTQLVVPLLGQPRTVLDVGCGDGAIGAVLRQAWPKVWMVGIEKDKSRHHKATWLPSPGNWTVYSWTCWTDWLAYMHTGQPLDLVISNPPFGLAALPFLQRAVERVAPGGTVAFLLPTHWDHDPDVDSAFARQRFLDSLRLPDGREGYARFPVVGGGPNPARPSFKKGGTASDRYAWFLFGSQWAGQPGRRLHAIPPEAFSKQLDLLGAS